MACLTEQFPLLKVNLSTFLTLVLFTCFFKFEAVSNEVGFRWNSNITKFTMEPINYRKEAFSTDFRVACFGLWTFEVLATLGIVVYHILVPPHPKFYSTRKNKFSIIVHMIGGSTGIVGLWVGVVTNLKEVCLVAVLFGLSLHWPSIIWQMRQLHGHREIMVPAYCFITATLFICYIEFFLYNGSFKSVFACAMSLNVFAMVRVSGFLMAKANIQASYDRWVLFAGFVNGPFIAGAFGPLILMVSIIVWNMYFEFFQPMPRNVMRIDRGYEDSVPYEIEAKRGIKFSEELEKQSKVESNKKEAISKALFRVLAGDDSVMDLNEVVDLYNAWGMPDAEPAAKSTFKRVDKDASKKINFKEFKKGFQIIIDNIYVKGEYETMQNTSKLLEMKNYEPTKEE